MAGDAAGHLREPVPRLGRFCERIFGYGYPEATPQGCSGVSDRPVSTGTVLVRGGAA